MASKSKIAKYAKVLKNVTNRYFKEVEPKKISILKHKTLIAWKKEIEDLSKKSEKSNNQNNRIAELQKLIKESGYNEMSFPEVIKTSLEISKLGGEITITRLRNHCSSCGNSRAVFRTIGLCRNCFKERAMCGAIPGIRSGGNA